MPRPNFYKYFYIRFRKCLLYRDSVLFHPYIYTIGFRYCFLSFFLLHAQNRAAFLIISADGHCFWALNSSRHTKTTTQSNFEFSFTVSSSSVPAFISSNETNHTFCTLVHNEFRSQCMAFRVHFIKFSYTLRFENTIWRWQWQNQLNTRTKDNKKTTNYYERNKCIGSFVFTITLYFVLLFSFSISVVVVVVVSFFFYFFSLLDCVCVCFCFVIIIFFLSIVCFTCQFTSFHLIIYTKRILSRNGFLMFFSRQFYFFAPRFIVINVRTDLHQLLAYAAIHFSVCVSNLFRKTYYIKLQKCSCNFLRLFLVSVATAIIISNKTCASINADGGGTTTTYSVITHTSWIRIWISERVKQKINNNTTNTHTHNKRWRRSK